MVTIGDDYNFPGRRLRASSPSSALLGGKIPKRVCPPLGTNDYSSYIAQIPKAGIDGYFWAVGGTGTVAFVKETAAGVRARLAKKNISGSDLFDSIVVGNFHQVVGGVTRNRYGGRLRQRRARLEVPPRGAEVCGPKLGAAAASRSRRSDRWTATPTGATSTTEAAWALTKAVAWSVGNISNRPLQTRSSKIVLN